MRPQLHVISTGQQSLETMMTIMEDIHPLIDYFHLREKNWSAQELMTAMTKLQACGVPREKILINDRVDVAYLMKATGVQLPHHSISVADVKKAFPNLLAGLSVHSLREAKQAEKNGADYLLYGHIYPTASKPNLEPHGLEVLQKLINRVTTPVIAIGGIAPKNISDVLQTGVAGVAVLSGILLADDPVKQAKAYRKALDE